MDLKMDGKRRESFTFLAWLVATPAAMAGLLTIYFCVGAIEWGPRGGERPANVGAEEVAEMFEATSDINDWNGAAKLTPSVEVLEGDGAVMRFNVTPGDGTASSAFLRIRR